ncbi:unnamed protein product [Protopolystoma xenopodis]|uniref:Uncharacterized protein n=1 Tax=Protopolystoma xenopodis TaxID=117903 RepID=A0A3S4ZZM8_9PLAT|nr:unnamed protein product [Protopolystoma xenopodis]
MLISCFTSFPCQIICKPSLVTVLSKGHSPKEASCSGLNFLSVNLSGSAKSGVDNIRRRSIADTAFPASNTRGAGTAFLRSNQDQLNNKESTLPNRIQYSRLSLHDPRKGFHSDEPVSRPIPESQYCRQQQNFKKLPVLLSRPKSDIVRMACLPSDEQPFPLKKPDSHSLGPTTLRAWSSSDEDNLAQRCLEVSVQSDGNQVIFGEPTMQPSEQGFSSKFSEISHNRGDLNELMASPSSRLPSANLGKSNSWQSKQQIAILPNLSLKELIQNDTNAISMPSNKKTTRKLGDLHIKSQNTTTNTSLEIIRVSDSVDPAFDAVLQSSVPFIRSESKDPQTNQNHLDENLRPSSPKNNSRITYTPTLPPLVTQRPQVNGNYQVPDNVKNKTNELDIVLIKETVRLDEFRQETSEISMRDDKNCLTSCTIRSYTKEIEEQMMETDSEGKDFDQININQLKNPEKVPSKETFCVEHLTESNESLAGIKRLERSNEDDESARCVRLKQEECGLLYTSKIMPERIIEETSIIGDQHEVVKQANGNQEQATAVQNLGKRTLKNTATPSKGLHRRHSEDARELQTTGHNRACKIQILIFVLESNILS